MKTELYQSPWTVFKSRQGFASFGIALLFVWIWFTIWNSMTQVAHDTAAEGCPWRWLQTRSINESCHAEKKFLVCCEWYNDNAWNGIPWFLMFPIEVWIDFSVSQGLCTVSQIKNHLNVICFEVLQNSRFVLCCPIMISDFLVQFQLCLLLAMFEPEPEGFFTGDSSQVHTYTYNYDEFKVYELVTAACCFAFEKSLLYSKRQLAVFQNILVADGNIRQFWNLWGINFSSMTALLSECQSDFATNRFSIPPLFLWYVWFHLQTDKAFVNQYQISNCFHVCATGLLLIGLIWFSQCCHNDLKGKSESQDLTMFACRTEDLQCEWIARGDQTMFTDLANQLVRMYKLQLNLAVVKPVSCQSLIGRYIQRQETVLVMIRFGSVPCRTIVKKSIE